MTNKKVVLITGVSSGMGRATALLLSQRGYLVFGTARNTAAVKPIPGVEMLALDVRDDASVEACVASVLRKTDRIDVLINNAGYGMVGADKETSPAEAKAMFDANLFGVLRMVRAVLPAMRHQGSGRIINISSILGFLPGPFFGLYAGSKHALEALLEDHLTTKCAALASAWWRSNQTSPTRSSAPTGPRPGSRSTTMQKA